jgi:O-methyltransferase involved in polyketide biosynthesis
MNNITITIQAPELVEAMQALTVALQSGTVKPAAVEQVIEKLEAEAKPKKAKADKPVPASDPVAEESKAQTNITLDDVRIALGNLSQAGKQAEVKTLIASFGATKLSEITSDKYADLMAQAEALNG